MTSLKIFTQYHNKIAARCRNKNLLSWSKLIQVSALQFLTAEFIVTDRWTCI